MGFGSVLGKGRRRRLHDDQRPCRDRRRETSFPRCAEEKAVSFPADGFYEWRKDGKTNPPSASPWPIADFAFAGIWDTWRNPNGQTVETFFIITTTPWLCADVHYRMPVILPEEHYAKWLGELENGVIKETAEALSSRGHEDVVNQFAGERSEKRRRGALKAHLARFGAPWNPLTISRS